MYLTGIYSDIYSICFIRCIIISVIYNIIRGGLISVEAPGTEENIGPLKKNGETEKIKIHFNHIFK